jgi:tetratricopeptide (TPR) repeat protein
VVTSLINFANLLSETQDYPAAETAYQEALKNLRALVEKKPDAFRSNMATTLNNMGNMLSDKEAYPEAEAAFREALDIRRKLAEEKPDAFLPDLAESLNSLATLLQGNESFAETETILQELLDIRRKLAEENPDVFGLDACETYINLAIVHHALLESTGDNRHFTAGLALLKDLEQRLAMFPPEDEVVVELFEYLEDLSTDFEGYKEG